MSDAISAAEFSNESLPDWRVVLGAAHGLWHTGSFTVGAAFVAAVAQVADELDHHPDVELRYPSVAVTLSSHDVGGLSARDIALATRIQQLAAELGLRADPTAVQRLEIAIDVTDGPAVQPFWRAVLGYDEGETGDSPASDLVDPAGHGTPIWFQQMDAPRPGRGRIHLDISVAADLAEQRVAAALAAGGTLVSAAAAPSFWVLADPEGNEACISTWQGRDG